MNHAKKLQFMYFIIYSIVASIGSKLLDIHFIHMLNALILSAILYHILDWKYDWVTKEELEEKKYDQSTDNG